MGEFGGNFEGHVLGRMRSGHWVHPETYTVHALFQFLRFAAAKKAEFAPFFFFKACDVPLLLCLSA